MVLIEDIRKKTYSVDEIKIWESYIDDLIDEEAERGVSHVNVLTNPDGDEIIKLDSHNLDMLSTIISMYKNEGFKVKVKNKKVNKKKKVHGLKISW